MVICWGSVLRLNCILCWTMTRGDELTEICCYFSEITGVIVVRLGFFSWRHKDH
jgi:hypothetical protein